MQRKFVTNLLLLLFINLLVKPIWIFGIDRQVQNITGPETYGMYYVLLNFSFLLNVVLDMGITNFNNRNIAQHNQLLSKYLSNVTIIKVLLSFVYILLTLLWAFIVGYSGYELHLLLVLVFNQVLSSFIIYLRSNLAGLHLFKTDSLISILDKLIMIILCAPLLLLTNTFDIAWFIYAQTIAFFITGVVAMLCVLQKAQWLRLKWNLPLLIIILRQCYPYAILSVVMTLYLRIDVVLIERLLSNGKTEAGYYAAAYRLFDAINMFAFLMSGLLLPIFSRMVKAKESVASLTKLSFSLLLLPCSILCIGCWFHAEAIVNILYTPDTASHIVTTFSVLMMALLGMSTTYIFGTLLTANGNIKLLNVIAIAGLVINISLNLWFIPIYGAKGAAYSALFTLSCVSLVQMTMAFKTCELSFNIRYIASLALIIGVTIASNLILKLLITNWFIAFLGSGAIALFTLFITDIIPLKDIRKLLNK